MSKTESQVLGNREIVASAQYQVARYLALTGISPESPRELRIFGGRMKGTLFGCFTSAQKLVDAIPPYIAQANIYISVNPGDPRFLGRANNTLVRAVKRDDLDSGADLATAPITLIDDEIKEVTCLYLDLDATRETKQGDCATQDELNNAIEVRDQIASDLAAVGVGSVKVMSGNGANLDVLVLPVVPSSGRIKAVLQGFKARYSSAMVEVDTKVGNPSRIRRLPGTLNMKQPGTGRPQRYARLDHDGPAPQPCDLAVIEDLLGIQTNKGTEGRGGAINEGSCVTDEEYRLLLFAWEDATVNGERHELALGLAGAARKAGHAKGVVSKLVTRLAADAQDEEAGDRVRVVTDTYAEPDIGKVAGWSKLEELELDPADFPSLSSSGTPPADNMASQLVEMGRELPLIRTQFGEFMIVVPLDNGRVEPTKISGGMFTRWLRLRYWEKYGKAASQQALSSAAGILEALAWKQGKSPMFNRVGRRDGGTIVLDLCDEEGRVALIDGDGWRLESETKPLFYRYAHQQAVKPPVKSGNPWSILDYVPLREADDKIMFVVMTIAALIPDIPQPIPILHGPQGSAKTTAARIRRALIDPSYAPVMPLTRNLAELVQMLNHNYMPILDNVSVVNLEQGNLLCQVSTGAGQSKRKLYTDDDDVVCQFIRQTTITCLSVPRAESDLIDRALLIPLERVGTKDRREERELWSRFESQRPEILGGMLDALSRAIKLFPQIRPLELPRMADFGRWATAIAVALGYDEAGFADVLTRVLSRQVTSIVDDDMVASAVVWLARRTAQTSGSTLNATPKYWEGTPTRLLDALKSAPCVNEKSKQWPNEAAVLGKKLVQLQTPLAQVGISVERSKSGDRLWRIEATA